MPPSSPLKKDTNSLFQSIADEALKWAKTPAEKDATIELGHFVRDEINKVLGGKKWTSPPPGLNTLCQKVEAHPAMKRISAQIQKVIRDGLAGARTRLNVVHNLEIMLIDTWMDAKPEEPKKQAPLTPPKAPVPPPPVKPPEKAAPPPALDIFAGKSDEQCFAMAHALKDVDRKIAESALVAALSRTKNPKIAEEVGDIYSNLDDAGNALPAYHKAASFLKDPQSILSISAKILGLAEPPVEADFKYLDSLLTSTQDPEIAQQAGDLYALAKAGEDALTAYKKAGEAIENPERLISLIEKFAKIRQVKEAIAITNKAQELSRDFVFCIKVANILRAAILPEVNNKGIATLPVYKKAGEFAKDYKEHEIVGNYLLDLGAKDEAEKVYGMAIKSAVEANGNVPAFFQLAKNLAEKDLEALSLQAFKEAIDRCDVLETLKDIGKAIQEKYPESKLQLKAFGKILQTKKTLDELVRFGTEFSSTKEGGIMDPDIATEAFYAAAQMSPNLRQKYALAKKIQGLGHPEKALDIALELCEISLSAMPQQPPVVAAPQSDSLPETKVVAAVQKDRPPEDTFFAGVSASEGGTIDQSPKTAEAKLQQVKGEIEKFFNLNPQEEAQRASAVFKIKEDLKEAARLAVEEKQTETEDPNEKGKKDHLFRNVIVEFLNFINKLYPKDMPGYEEKRKESWKDFENDTHLQFPKKLLEEALKK